MRKVISGALGACVAVIALAGSAVAGEKNWGTYQVGDTRSGYTYATPPTRAIQDDDFMNPAMLWVDQGEELWSKVDGEAGKSCAACHNDAAKSMRTVGARYPVFEKSIGKLMNVEQRINQCRVQRMKAKPYKWESTELLSLTSYVKLQSRGEPVSVKIDGEAKPFFEKGKAFYFQRRGLLDMACANCHVENPGNMIRANLLSQGQSNGFPTYRLKWQKPGSLHRRFRGCNKQVRAQPYAYGADEYVNLELYVAWRGQGLPVETPSVRN
jgi:L-cysteine S-thiosulfotransferase